MKIHTKWYIFVLFAMAFIQGYAQSDNEEYTRVITERSDKILKPLDVGDSTTYYKVREVLVGQYATLNAHHENRDAKIKVIKETYKEQKDLLDKKRTAYEAAEDKKLSKIHKKFVSKLEKLIPSDKVDEIKDGMTYGILPLTYGAYQDMIPSLTDVQKAKILEYLTEAREIAMDQSSSHDKHGVFGKIKGRINNYLSAEGYNLKEEGDRWEQRNAQKNKN